MLEYLLIDTFVKSAVYMMEGGKISRGGKGAGGLAIGYMQNDCSTNDDALSAFRNMMENEIGKTINGQLIDQPYVDKIVKDSQSSHISNDEYKIEYKIAKYAVNDPLNEQILDKLNNDQLNLVIGRVQEAFAAAASNLNGPGELNSIAPNPELITEIASWANQSSPGLWDTLIDYLEGKKVKGNGVNTVSTIGATQITQTNFENQYLYKQKLFNVSTEDFNAQKFRANWPGRISGATYYAEQQIGATVSTINSSNAVVNASQASSTGPNYLSLNSGVDYLWSFAKSANNAVAGAITIFVQEASSAYNSFVATKQGWTKIVGIGDPELEITDNTDNSNGNILTSSNTISGDDGEILSTDNTTNTYDANNNLSSSLEYKTDMSGNPATSDTTCKTYNSSGNLLTSSEDQEDQTDAKGNITDTDNAYASGALSSSSVIKIDTSGNMTYTSTKYDASGNALPPISETTTDANGKITDTYSSAANGIILSSTAGNGNLIYQSSGTIDGASNCTSMGDVLTNSYNTSTNTYTIVDPWKVNPSEILTGTDTITANAGGGYTETWNGPSAFWGDSYSDGTQNGTYDTSTLSFNESLDEPISGTFYPTGTTTSNADGSYTTTTFNPRNGISTSTTYYGNGSYNETWSSCYGYGSGQNSYSADGSYSNSVSNPDGSWVSKTYVASTGVTKSTFGDGRGGSQTTWTGSDGSCGETDIFDDGSGTATDSGYIKRQYHYCASSVRHEIVRK
ncbi:MAG: hypothetical protein ACLPP9_13080 [Smithella sp.]